MDSTKYKFHLISNDIDGKKKEKGIFRFWRGYLSYDNLPIMQVIGNHNIAPGNKEDGTQKKPWLVLNESVSQKDREELEENGQKPDEFGFVTFSEIAINKEIKETAKIITANIFDTVVPMSGWVNRKTIDNKETDTLCLSYSASDFDYWQDRLKDQQYILGDDSICENEWLDTCKILAADFKEYQEFIDKYFPSSRNTSVTKRKSILNNLVKKAKKTKVIIDEF